jgi:type III restriction enzyme
MGLHKDFPKDKFQILEPSIRWFPADEDLRKTGYEKLMPPFVPGLRKRIYEWRKNNYEGATETSKSLLNWWFKEPHLNAQNQEFQYYFAQREAVETVIFLYDVRRARNKLDLFEFNELGRVSANMFDEDWLRFVIKMATGSGKTKVMSLVLTWSYFHKLYEENSELAKNFLLITPNIIVLDRIKSDFEGLKIFYEDPVLPENGYDGHNWQDDFQIKLHLQDEVGSISDSGNIFLTNIHRVYDTEVKDFSVEDVDTTEYFLGQKVVGKTNDSRVDLGEIIRDIDEIVVINDEAHHIHDPDMAWFQSIKDINSKMLRKGKNISLQIDVTATPKNNRGEIFVQTISDYPLVEAIHQDVVKQPVLPDGPSREKLQPKQSAIFSQKYEDYLRLGVEEWRKTYEELSPTGKKPILFIMTDDTKNCDDVAEFLEKNYREFEGAVLTIHTNKNGEIAENVTGKKEKELIELRKKANEIDSLESPYKVIVSVMMLKEGWDVKNVTTIVGLRPFAADSKILPEQTLGRGLRKMFFGQNVEEYVSIIGTPAFMEFVESINNEGVVFEKRRMDKDSRPIVPTVIEVNNKNDIEKLDIKLPVLTPRIKRNKKDLHQLDVSKFGLKKFAVKTYTKEELKEVIFKYVVEDKEHHRVILDNKTDPDYQNVVGWFVKRIAGELRMYSSYDTLFIKVKDFISDFLFENPVDITNPQVLKNLSDPEIMQAIIETFKDEINKLTVQDTGNAEFNYEIKISSARPFVVNDKEYITPKKSIFNKIIGDSYFELEFANFLDNAEDVLSFAKNYYEIHFRIDYKNANGSISNYYPDFFVKIPGNTIYIVETKGREDLDDVEKIKRLFQWCKDATQKQNKYKYEALYVKQEVWDKYKAQSFADLIKIHKREE